MKALRLSSDIENNKEITLFLPETMPANKGQQQVGVLLGMLALALVIRALQYHQHMREERTLRGSIQLDHDTEFERPEGRRTRTGQPVTQSGANISARIDRLERAMLWVEQQRGQGRLPQLADAASQP